MGAIGAAAIGAAGTIAAASMRSGGASSAAGGDMQSMMLGMQQLGLQREQLANQKSMYEQNRADMAPWRDTGASALSELARRMGLGPRSVTTAATPNVTRATFDAQTYLAQHPELAAKMGAGTGASEQPAQNPLTRDMSGQSFYIMGDYGNMIPYLPYQSGNVDPNQTRYTKRGEGFYEPITQAAYAAAQKSGPTQQELEDAAWQDFLKNGGQTWTPGTTTDLTADGMYGSLLKPYRDYENFTLDKFYADPSYQFRLNEGLRALQGSAAAKGGFFSGNTGRAITDYGQDLASTEYQNAFNRYGQEYGIGLNKYNQDQANVYNRLSNIAGLGQTSASQIGNLGLGTMQGMNSTLNSMGSTTSAMMNSLNNNAAMSAYYQNLAGQNRGSMYSGLANQIMGAYGAYNQNKMYSDLIDSIRNVPYVNYQNSLYNSGASQYSSGLFGGNEAGSGMVDNWGDPIGY